MLYPTELRPHIHAKMLRQILTLVNHSGILMPLHFTKCVGSSGVEQETLNLLAVGSNPTRRTKKSISLALVGFCFVQRKEKVRLPQRGLRGRTRR
ncbi:MAG: hypothetical protein UY76_C0028G0011 [Candidatus Uhrbacteria bacterium GW2011_GWA2_52_8d]|uniref:Uncharacterized protein n=1 Tax=Candidatus Uhrbacteria bacterium GW2011_GWA2_52_8d TaxID=1618979 RepID=A0A0G1XNI9_9BACT|nr:MAG: hypothetical protein UY76_C0028G0011 [Candidatus Uhrbacteria bacterium GW2011_GWA2_52_8d]